MSWQEQAERLTTEAVETGTEAAFIVAAAWRARVDHRATDSLAEAALALWATPESMLRGGAWPLPNDRELIGRSEDLEGEVSVQIQRARTLFEQAESVLEAAHEAARAAADAIASAQTAGEASAAQAALADAGRYAGDCEAALEILQDAIQRLEHAYACLIRVPEDLAETYETCYDHIRRGGKLPFSGDFLTGAAAAATEEGAA